MTDLTRWTPFADLEAIRQEIGRLVSEELSRPERRGERTGPTIDVTETDEEIVVSAELPGFDPQDLDVTLSRGAIVLCGQARDAEEQVGERYYARRRRWDAFRRRIPLPADVDVDKAKATFRHGLLEVRLPRFEDARPRALDIEVH